MQHMRATIPLSACLLLIPAFSAAKRPITETDLYAFRWIAAPQISPDGARIVYTRVVVNAKHDSYETSLWIVAANGSAAGGSARPLTAGTHDANPRWSPDGRTLAFLRAPDPKDKDGKPQPAQIYLLSIDGGEARALTDMPKGASGLAWAPDGQSIAFLSTTPRQRFRQEKKQDEGKTNPKAMFA